MLTSHTSVITHTHTLGFNILAKDPLACKVEEPVIELQTFQLVNNCTTGATATSQFRGISRCNHPSTNQTANHSEASCIKQNVSARSEEVDKLKIIKKRNN